MFLIPMTVEAQEVGEFNYYNLLGFLTFIVLLIGLAYYLFAPKSRFTKTKETTNVLQEQIPKESANVKEETDSSSAYKKLDKAIGAILGINIQETMSYEEAWEIASEYGYYLEHNKGIYPGAQPLSALSHSIEKIKTALATLVILDQNVSAKEAACLTYTFLDDFVEDDIYTPLANAFGNVSADDVQNMSKSELMEMAGNFDLISEFYKRHDSKRDITLNELIKLRMLAGLEVEFYVNQLSELREKNS